MFYTLNYTVPKDHDMLITCQGYVAYELIERTVLWAIAASYDRSLRKDCFWTTFHYDLKGFRGALYLPDSVEPTEDFRKRVVLDLLSRFHDSDDCIDVNEGELTIEPLSTPDFCRNLARIEAIVISYGDKHCCAPSDRHHRVHPSETPYE